MVFPNACGWIQTSGIAGGFGLSPNLLKPACHSLENLSSFSQLEVNKPFPNILRAVQPQKQNTAHTNGHRQ